MFTHTLLGGMGRNRVPAAGGGGGGFAPGNGLDEFFATSTSPTTSAVSITTGSAVVVAVWCQTGAPTSVTDSASNTYNIIDTQQIASFGDKYLSCYYAQNVTGGSLTWTVTYTGSRNIAVVVMEIDGAATSSYQSTTKAKSNSDGANPRELATGASVTSGHMVVHVGASNFGGAETFTANTPFTKRREELTSAWNVYIGTYIAESTGTVTGTYNQTASDSTQMIWAMAPA